jgi:hypothetical protein
LLQEPTGCCPLSRKKDCFPPGIHHTTFEEFKQRFVYFNRSDRRFRLFDRLQTVYEEARRSDIVRRFLVVGSFVTSKPEPNDFECILVLEPSIIERVLRPMEYDLVSIPMARRKFGGDVFSYREGTPALDEMIEFFQLTRSGQRMGIVEIQL